MAFESLRPSVLWRNFRDKAFSAGRTLVGHLAGLKARILGDTRASIVEGWENGESSRELANRIRPTKKPDGKGAGIAGRAYRDLDAITEGAAQAMAVSAQELLTTLNRGLVGRVSWRAVLDSKVCPICGALHGKTWRVDKSGVSLRTDRAFDFPSPPAHARCRCSLLFARVGEALPKDQSFDDWLRGQTESVRRDVLGKTKAKLYDVGELSIKDFVRGDEELTLRQMRKSYLDVFEAADIGNLVDRS